jgi:tetratricopeptide (TPR) repeat protein
LAIDKDKILAEVQKHLNRNNVDRALRELAVIVREDPKDLRVRQKVAELLARQGKLAEAMREFQVVAEAYERGGFFPKAAAIYKQMLRLEPDSMRWHLSLGEIYLQLALMSDAADHFGIVARHTEKNGTSQERAEIYQKLLRLNPDNLEYAEKLAEVYAKENDVVAAAQVWEGLVSPLEGRQDWENLTRVLEKLSSLRPEDLDLVHRLANHYLDRGDPKRALAKLQISFKANPQDTETLNLLADAFVDLGEKEKAVAVLKELAQIYEQLGYEEYRSQVWDRIAELDPAQGGAVTGGGSIEVVDLSDRIDEVLLLEAESVSAEAQAMLFEAEVLLEYGLSERTAKVLESAAARFAQSFEVRRAYVRWLVHGGQLSAAGTQLEAMYEIAMDRSDYDAARACLVRARDLDPEDEAARARLVAFEEAMGDEGPGTNAGGEREFVGEAVRLGHRIANADEAEADDIDEEFDFDDEELQNLAAQVQEQLGPRKSMPATAVPKAPVRADPVPSPPVKALDPEPEPDDDDLFAGLDDLGDADTGSHRLSAYDLGMSYYKTGMYDDATVEFRRAVGEGERLSEALEMLGMCQRRLRDFKGAAESFRRVLQERLVTGELALKVLFELGVTYEASGDRKSAYKVYKRIIDQSRDYRDGEVLNRVESLAMELGIQE